MKKILKRRFFLGSPGLSVRPLSESPLLLIEQLRQQVDFAIKLFCLGEEVILAQR
jgi:hypothetical protein